MSTSPVIDKRGLLPRLATMPRVELEFGVGGHKRHGEAIGVDMRDFEGVDLVGDIWDVLALIPDRSVDAVYSYHFAEHLPDLSRLVREVHRILKPGGLMRTVVPHFSNPYYYSDYTHRSFFGLYTFSYLAEDTLFRRGVPKYLGDTGLVLTDVQLGFKSTPPFYLRHAFRKVLGLLVNMSHLTQELYEAGWAFWFPCYEVRYEVRRRPEA